MKILRDTRASQWSAIVDRLTLSQLNKTMGDDYRTWVAKANRTLQITKSKTIHDLCHKLLKTCEQLQVSTVYFQGLALPRTTLITALIHAHVIAVHEFDHDTAEDIEDYLFDLGHFAEQIDSISSEQITKLQYLKAVQS